MGEERLTLIGKSRRDILSGHVGHRRGHIASLLVQAWPQRLAEVERCVQALPGVESHGAAGAGKLILTVEAAGDAALLAAVDRIQATAGVITASLVYHAMDGAMEEETADDR